MTNQRPHREGTAIENNESSERGAPCDSRRCSGGDCARCMSEMLWYRDSDTGYINRKEAVSVMCKLAGGIHALWVELKKHPLELVLANLSKHSENGLVELLDDCFPDLLGSEQVMNLMDGTLYPKQSSVIAGLRCHNLLSEGTAYDIQLEQIIASRRQYSPNFFAHEENANMELGWDLRAFDLEVCDSDGDFLVQLHPVYCRIHPNVRDNGKTLHRPDIHTFERAMCILRCQESVYQTLTRMARFLAGPEAAPVKKVGFNPFTNFPSWRQELSKVANLVEGHLKTITNELSQLRTSDSQLKAEVQDLQRCLKQAYRAREPPSSSDVCCYLSTRVYERVVIFSGLLYDVQDLSSRVAQYSHASPELVHVALEVVERDCVWLIKQLMPNIADLTINNVELVEKMTIREGLQELPPVFWQDLRATQPLEWHILRLHLAQGDLPGLITLLLQYLDEHSERFHARLGSIIEDFRLIKVVIVATEALHPSSRARFDADHSPGGSVRSCIELMQSFDDRHILEVVDTSSSGTEDEGSLRQTMRITTLAIWEHTSAYLEISDSLREPLTTALGLQLGSGRVTDTSRLMERFQETRIGTPGPSPSKARGYNSIFDPTTGMSVPSVATRPDAKSRMPRRLVEPLVGPALQLYQPQTSHLLAQPEKGSRFQESSQRSLKEKRPGTAATNVEEAGPEYASAPQSPVILSQEFKRLVFTNRQHYDTWCDVMQAEGSNSGDIDMSDVRRMLTSPPLNFRETVKNNTFMYSRLGQDGWDAGTVSFHGPHAGRDILRYVLNGIKKDLRKEFGWTGEMAELEEATARG